MGSMVHKSTVTEHGYTGCAAITPHDTDELTKYARALSFSNSGAQTLKITTLEGNDVTLTGLPTGIYPIAAKRVFSTGTTVTNVAAYW